MSASNTAGQTGFGAPGGQQGRHRRRPRLRRVHRLRAVRGIHERAEKCRHPGLPTMAGEKERHRAGGQNSVADPTGSQQPLQRRGEEEHQARAHENRGGKQHDGGHLVQAEVHRGGGASRAQVRLRDRSEAEGSEKAVPTLTGQPDEKAEPGGGQARHQGPGGAGCGQRDHIADHGPRLRHGVDNQAHHGHDQPEHHDRFQGGIQPERLGSPGRGARRRFHLAGDRLHPRLHLAGAAEPFGPLLLQGPEDDGIHTRVHRAFFRRRRKPSNRQLPGEHLVKHHAQGIDIGPLVHILRALQLLRGHVVGRPNGRAAGGELGRRLCVADQLGDAEVGDLHPAAGIEQDVLRLDVAMENAFVVRILQRLANPGHQGQGLGRCEPARLHGLAQVDPIHILHHQKEKLTRLAEIIDRHNARVVQARQHPGLPVESLGERRVGPRAVLQELERHAAIQFRLAGFIDDAHPAMAEQLDDLQLRERRPQPPLGPGEPAGSTAGNRLRWESKPRPAGIGRTDPAARPQAADHRTSGKSLTSALYPYTCFLTNAWPEVTPNPAGATQKNQVFRRCCFLDCNPLGWPHPSRRPGLEYREAVCCQERWPWVLSARLRL